MLTGNEFILALSITCGIGALIIALALILQLYDKIHPPKTKTEETGGQKLFVTIMMILFSPVILLGDLFRLTLKGIRKLLTWLTRKKGMTKMDKRKWYQKFFDQTYFGSQYTLQITPEQANRALHSLRARPSKNWRIKSLIEDLELAIAHPTKVNKQQVITLTVDTSDGLTLKDILHFNKENIESRTETNGFTTTTTKYGTAK